MKNKILIIILCIFTFGIFLLPSGKAFSSSDLDYTNRLVSIEKVSSYASGNVKFYFNVDGLESNSNYYFTMQCFKKDDLTTPIVPSAVSSGTTYIYVNNSNYGLSTYTTNSNYGIYRNVSYSPSSYNYFMWYIYGIDSVLNNYCFNICLVKSYSNGFIGSFVPNTYYNLNGFNDRGVFQYTSVYTLNSGVNNSPVDVSNIMIGNNIIKANSLYSEFYSTNNSSSTANYYIRVAFEGGWVVNTMPNLSIKYLELLRINVNGVSYSYNDAKNNFSWLYNNIVLYNDSATLFVNSDNSSINDIIYSIDFRIADYSFKSSSYYNSTIGLNGYLNSFNITVLNTTQLYDYNIGYENGYNNGFNDGQGVGYEKGVSESSSGFDNLMFAIANVPMGIISSMLNFEILGINLLSFFMAIITLMLFVYLIRKFKE